MGMPYAIERRSWIKRLRENFMLSASHRKTRKKKKYTEDTDETSQGFRVPRFLFLIKIGIILVMVHVSLKVDCSSTTVSWNVAVPEGQPVILNCSAPRRVAWVAYAPGSPDRQYIYTSTVSLPSYRLLHESADQYDLSFNATQSFGKRYQCQGEDSGTTIANFEVIVLDVPRCFVTIDTQHVNASCSIKFFGNWAPTLQWEWCIGENKSDFGSSQMHFVRGQTVSSTVSTRASAISNSTEPWKWQCITKFTESGRPSHATGSNVPEYSHSWSTEWITYGAWENSSELDQLHPDETEECSCNTVLSVFLVLSIIANLLLLAWKFKLCTYFHRRLGQYSFGKGNDRHANNIEENAEVEMNPN